MIYEPSSRYINSVILHSGTLLASSTELFSSNELTNRTKAVFKICGCNYDSLNSTSFRTCIQNLTTSMVFNCQNNYYNNEIIKGDAMAGYLNPIFLLVNDGVVFKESIKTSMKNQNFKSVNVLGGFTSDEASFRLGPVYGTTAAPNITLELMKSYLNRVYTYFLRYPDKPDSTFVDLLINQYTKNYPVKNYFRTLLQIMSEEFFICPTMHFAEIYSEKNKVYLFSFEQASQLSIYKTYYGVNHSYQDFLFRFFLYFIYFI